jgi:hypothetical protein
MERISKRLRNDSFLLKMPFSQGCRLQDAAGHDDTLKQSKEFEEAHKIHDELDKAQQEDRATQA